MVAMTVMMIMMTFAIPIPICNQIPKCFTEARIQRVLPRSNLNPHYPTFLAS